MRSLTSEGDETEQPRTYCRRKYQRRRPYQRLQWTHSHTESFRFDRALIRWWLHRAEVPHSSAGNLISNSNISFVQSNPRPVEFLTRFGVLQRRRPDASSEESVDFWFGKERLRCGRGNEIEGVDDRVGRIGNRAMRELESRGVSQRESEESKGTQYRRSDRNILIIGAFELERSLNRMSRPVPLLELVRCDGSLERDRDR